MACLFAGTSGFAYPGWKPAFYPGGLPERRFLEHYASRLNCVEVNYTFRRLASEATLEKWAGETPSGFVFAVKAHMRITHVLRLANAEEATQTFLRTLNPLGRAGRLGPVLFQLPPNLKCDSARLAAFLSELPRNVRFAFEFRHESWLVHPVYDLLAQHNVSLCVAESDKFEVPEVITADFVYYRLRKPEYGPEELRAIASRAAELLSSGRDLYLLFKHEDTPEGALNAEKVLGMIPGG